MKVKGKCKIVFFPITKHLADIVCKRLSMHNSTYLYKKINISKKLERNYIELIFHHQLDSKSIDRFLLGLDRKFRNNYLNLEKNMGLAKTKLTSYSLKFSSTRV